jgi:hypothetical protein
LQHPGTGAELFSDGKALPKWEGAGFVTLHSWQELLEPMLRVGRLAGFCKVIGVRYGQWL